MTSRLSRFTKTGNACGKAVAAFAAAAPDPIAVSEAAKLSPPRPGTPSAPPTTPQSVAAGLTPDGHVTVSWRGSVQSVTFVYQRQLHHADGTGTGWVNLNHAGGRPFVDETVPAGTVEAFYAVKAVAGKRSSDWSDPGGVRFVASSSNATSLKMAA